MNTRLDTERILKAKQERLKQRQAKTPPAAVLRLAEMQVSPLPLLNVVTDPGQVWILGQVTYQDIYDPVGAALRLNRLGVDGVAFYSDNHVYSNGLEDLLLVCRGVRLPVLYQNYLLDEYHVAEARAAGAAAITLYASVLPAPMLRRTVSIAQRWRMTTVVQVENSEQLEYVQTLSPHVICVGDPHFFDTAHDLALLREVRRAIPAFTHVMLLGCLRQPEHVHAALDLGVDALVLDESLLNDAPAMRDIRARIDQINV